MIDEMLASFFSSNIRAVHEAFFRETDVLKFLIYFVCLSLSTIGLKMNAKNSIDLRIFKYTKYKVQVTEKGKEIY